MSLFTNLRKKFTEFMQRLLAPRSEKSLLEIERELRQRRREKVAARASGRKDQDVLAWPGRDIIARIRSGSAWLSTRWKW